MSCGPRWPNASSPCGPSAVRPDASRCRRASPMHRPQCARIGSSASMRFAGRPNSSISSPAASRSTPALSRCAPGTAQRTRLAEDHSRPRKPERDGDADFDHRPGIDWHRVDPAQLNELAEDRARDACLRAMSPVPATALWIEPLMLRSWDVRGCLINASTP